MRTTWVQLVLVLVLVLVLGGENFYVAVSGSADSQDAAVLRSLKGQWLHTPPSWDTSDDPCDSKWEGIICNDFRVTELKLSSMGLSGQLSGDIGGLTELRILDLSFNRDLTGPVSPMIGNLQNLTTLILAGCHFNGNIPNEIGNLKKLSYLALNSNYFTGNMPPSLGMLSNVTWLDVADNQLSGPLPVSTSTTPGLDMLLNARHFHFNKNKLSGNIPAKLFSSEMKLIHILLDGNELTGSIPSTLGLIKSLLVLRLDRNHLSGEVPSSLNNLTDIIELNLANNQLTGPIPDLTSEMTNLNYVDLSNNLFDKSEAPIWFSTIQSLTILVMECGTMHGQVPQELFRLPGLQEVRLKNNSFNSSAPNIVDSINEQLQLVDLENNNITEITFGSRNTSSTLKLSGNPVCKSNLLANDDYCQNRNHSSRPYSTSYADCGNTTCPSGQMHGPQRCDCAYPYKATLTFNAPLFRDLSNSSLFQLIENQISEVLGVTPGSVSLQNPNITQDGNLQVRLELFPSTGKYFNRSEIQKIGFDLSYQTVKAPPVFGLYSFIAVAEPYPFPDRGGFGGVIIGLAVGCALLVVVVVVVVGVGPYAVRQKKRAKRAIKINKPFESNGSQCSNCGANIIPYPLSTDFYCGHPDYNALFCNISSGQLSFRTLSGSYLISSINADTRTLVIKLEGIDRCWARSTKRGDIHLNGSQPFRVTSNNTILLFNCSTSESSTLSCTNSSVCYRYIQEGRVPCYNQEKCCSYVTSNSSYSVGVLSTRCNAYASIVNLNLSTSTYNWWEGVQVSWDPLPDGDVRVNYSNRKRRLPMIISTTITVGVFSLGTIFYFLWRKIKEKGDAKSHRSPDISTFGENNRKDLDVPFYEFRSVLQATENFSESNKIGQGGFGHVYKGKLPEGQEIAAKRLSRNSGQGQEEFKNEVMLIAKLQHRNLVRLLGYCIKEDELILLYEYMPNKSLDYFLFDSNRRKLLSWEKRHNIILGIAKGLLYLHEDSRLRIIHRDLKTSNILLDEEMRPKISDFGLARIFAGNQNHENTNRVVGTYGYMSPEYAFHGLFSVKSDVFSFGVILLEIISGKKNSLIVHNEESLTLLGHAWKLWKEEKWMDFVDGNSYEVCELLELKRCFQIGLLCVQENSADRPNMASVVSMFISETTTLQAPKQPAFITTSLPNPRPSSSSKNEVTISTFGGR